MWSVSPGEFIGDRFEVVRPLGRGAHGQIYVAIQHPLGRQVAVKLLRPSGDELKAEEAFRREAAALARLAHPCCVQVFDYGVWQGQLYLVMELVQGQSLRALMRGRPLPVDRAVSIAVQIARGLSHAHREGIVHRDLSPANVMVLDDDQDGIGVRLVDFGLALVASDEDGPRVGPSLDGTPSYIAPERIQGGLGDARSDVYAAGLILFEMLTGVHPFRRHTHSATLQAHLREPVPALSELLPGVRVPVAIEFAVLASTARDPDDRPSDGSQLRKLMIAGLLSTTNTSSMDGLPSLEDGMVRLPPQLEEPATAPSGVAWAYRTSEPRSSSDPSSNLLPIGLFTSQPTQETAAVAPSVARPSDPNLWVLGMALLATSLIALLLLGLRLVLG
ncbi:MAG: serine/threonine-protein kinase [Myxococcota bacterium]